MKKVEYQHPTIEIDYFVVKNIFTASDYDFSYTDEGEGDILVWEP